MTAYQLPQPDVGPTKSGPGLSIVIPVFNEASWISVAVRDVVTAQQRSGFWPAELVIVDDGSEESTRAELDRLEAQIPIRVLHQPNQGRFAARRRGIEAATHDLVLLVDSRVSMHPDSLRFVRETFEPDECLPIWNAHVEVEVEGNPYARFWNILTEAAFASYFSRPRTTSYGLDDFDRFPKGTTAFLAPRRALLAAIDEFESFYSDARHANDDTILIRSLARSQRINISPGFSCLYRGRRSARDFVRHAHHRGIVFLDGYGRPGTRFFPVLVAFFPASLIAVAALVRWPRLLCSAALALPASIGLVGLGIRRNRRDAASLAALGPVWLLAYSAGIWRGAVLAFRSRLDQ